MSFELFVTGYLVASVVLVIVVIVVEVRDLIHNNGRKSYGDKEE